MGGVNSSEEDAKNIKKLNEVNGKLSSYKNNTSDLAKLALRHLDKRIVKKHDYYLGKSMSRRPDIYTICIRDNFHNWGPAQVNCDTGWPKYEVKDFPNLDCKNGERMYVLDNHRIPLVSKKLNMYNINDDYDGLANSSVYHAIRCSYDGGVDDRLLDKRSEILRGSKFSYDNNVLQGSIDALGLDTAKLTEHKYKHDNSTIYYELARRIRNDDEFRLKEEGFKNKRKQQNSFNSLNTIHYQ